MRLRVLFILCCVGLAGCKTQYDRTGQPGDPCEDNLSCVIGLVCQEQTTTCQDPAGEGKDGLAAACVDNRDCIGDLKCQAATMTCQIVSDGGIPGPALLGDPCDADEECDIGLVCQYEGESCQYPGGEGLEGIGSSCITNGDCPDELYCQKESNTCQLPLPE